MVALPDRGRPSPQGAEKFKLIHLNPRVGENGIHRVEPAIKPQVTFMPEVNPLIFSSMTRGKIVESFAEDDREVGRIVETRYNGGGPDASIDWQSLRLLVYGLPNLTLRKASVEVVENPTDVKYWDTRAVVVTLPESISSIMGKIAGFTFSAGKCTPLLDTFGPKGEVIPLKTPPHGDLPFVYIAE